ncbi:serine hydrolase domain-containing protein [Kibdelosporangium phytohabitans]|uniref:Serine hydrolase n=1 Tax=Kibdelosporangium phytohabitans TaxID=860235 RepID=A0A0N9HV05_9PSEU|nr:serine hydrolase domain-containing protein [Kibdelosporangium phytohabitans]ALG11148.1 serine hydrolase [Kibdelosporangium phytohabitans]MBE1462401.1 CubicO group peptidase (beta-lactamase class C family) [Kibdelosporangium phytohabitans]
MQSLALVDGWPVDNVAVTVIGRDGRILGSRGDQAHLFPLASVTKLLTSYAVLIAVEEGAVELDEPAGPEGATVRHLLAHASGLAMSEDKVQAQPGTRRIYSNAGFEALAEHVQQASGIPFNAYLAEAVVAPLSMNDTTLKGSPAHAGVSTCADLSRFAAELLAPTLVSGQLFDEATTVVFPGLNGVLPGFGHQKPNDWGLGFSLRDHKSPHWTGQRNSPETFGHFGQSGTFLWVDPRAGIATIALTDRAFGEWAAEVWPVLSDAVLEEASA